MTSLLFRLVLGLFLSTSVAAFAYIKKSLSTSGVVAAIFVGTFLFSMGRPFWYVPLLIFFLSSSLLSRWERGEKEQAERHFAKTGRRDGFQVLANGAIPCAFALLYAVFQDTAWVYGFVGSLATVTADTWATEYGTTSRAHPRHIVNGQRVDRGTSGGVTVQGTFAGALGAALIGLSAYVLWPINGENVTLWFFIAVTTISGVLGSLVDSVLGAVLQKQYRCSVCDKTVEKDYHCGRRAVAFKGIFWMTNDTVNALSSLAGGTFLVLLTINVS